ncbi:MAG TPA: VOC family protein [Miltoncostaeaceae bacterium]|nr:VOC family protein [Miltoncostaeaceae bacterium]
MADIFPVVCTDEIDASRDFYAGLLGLDVVLECGWYTLLRMPGAPDAQLGLVTRGHPSVPEGFGRAPRGVLVTVEVEDVDAVHARALALGLAIVQELRDEPFGQRHFMTTDPDGLLVDVVTPIPLSPGFAREVAALRRARRAGRS